MPLAGWRELKRGGHQLVEGGHAGAAVSCSMSRSPNLVLAVTITECTNLLVSDTHAVSSTDARTFITYLVSDRCHLAKPPCVPYIVPTTYRQYKVGRVDVLCLALVIQSSPAAPFVLHFCYANGSSELRVGRLRVGDQPAYLARPIAASELEGSRSHLQRATPA